LGNRPRGADVASDGRDSRCNQSRMHVGDDADLYEIRVTMSTKSSGQDDGPAAQAP